MERDKRFYPIDEELFNRLVLPIIESSYIGKGRPPKVSHYKAFCGILYILRTGIPRRDLPLEYEPVCFKPLKIKNPFLDPRTRYLLRS